jgi:two-component system chemotaxis sensor kinase CheA
MSTSLATLAPQLQELLGRFGLELAVVEAGKDRGLLPINSFSMEITDLCAPATAPEALREAAAVLRSWIDRIFDTTALFDEPTIALLSRWHGWMETAITALERGKELPALPPEFSGATPAAAPEKPAPVPAPATPAAEAAPATEPTLIVNVAADGELIGEFINESQEHLANIENGVLVLEDDPTNADTLNTIFRAFHTFKGGSGFLNLLPIQALAHELESLLDAARQHKLALSSPIIDVILEGGDTLKKFVTQILAQLNGQNVGEPICVPTSALIARVQEILVNPAAPAASPAAEKAAPAVEPTLTFAPPTPEPEPPDARVIIPISTTTPAAREPAKPAASAAAGASAAGFVKVDTTKLDALIDLVGELVISESMVVQDPELLKSPSRNLARNLGQLRRITSELQRTAMSLRMVPIKATFQKMTRLVRDLAAKQRKQVQLVFGGEDTELDRNIVEELSDPLVHMIRNSADHGVEMPDVRVAGGKPALGTIHLRAFHQGGNIVIQIQDDGAGLNKERILAKAIEKGLVKPGETLPDKDIFALIFAAGFSTAEKITDISGRGVGMDVVRRNIEKLRGKIDIDSVPGQGTTFSIFLPLTLAIIDGMIVSVGGERYIIPTLAVRESFRPRTEMLSTVHERGEMVNVRGKLCPLLRLYDYFDQPTKITEPTDGIVVVVESGNQTRCLLVDELIGKQEVVIKSLGGALRKNPSLAGGAVLGDGRVGLILNVDALVKLNHALPLAA